MKAVRAFLEAIGREDIAAHAAWLIFSAFVQISVFAGALWFVYTFGYRALVSPAS